MPAAASGNRPLIVFAVILGVLLALGVVLTCWPDQAQPAGTPTLENRRLIDGDPTPPDEPEPPKPPADAQTAPAPATPSQR